LKKIPLISKVIIENRNLAAGLVARLFDEIDAPSQKFSVIMIKGIGMEKQKHSSSCLIADGLPLIVT